MTNTVNEIHAFFKSARQVAPTRFKRFVNEMEDISVKRAKNLINDATANQKMHTCCLKNGVNPSVVENSYFEAQQIKMLAPEIKPIDFDANKKGSQGFCFKSIAPSFSKTKNKSSSGFKPVNLFAEVKPTNQVFKPVNLFGSQPTSKHKSSINPVMPKINISFPKQKTKVHQGRFEAVDLIKGPKSNDFFIVPKMDFGPKQKAKKDSKKSFINIKPIKFGGLF